MKFLPRMNNSINGFSVMGGLRRRQWNGVVADLWDVQCAPGAGGYYVSEDPRLIVLLDANGGTCQNRLSRNGTASVQDYSRPTMCYIPAGVELWTQLKGVDRIRHLDLHFNRDVLSRRLMEELDPERIDNLRMAFSDRRFLAIADLIAQECANPQPLHDLYGDGLALALFIDIMRLSKAHGRKRSQLATWQLRRATDYIEENCLRSVRLEELATLTGLSQSHFSHAFKASTGVSPHQWQTNARIDHAKALILKNEAPLTGVAAESGFSDQAHFTRVFRKTVGTTPANWKKSRLA